MGGGLVYFKQIWGAGLFERGGHLIYQSPWYQFSIKNYNTKWKSSSYKKLDVMQPRIKNKSELQVSE